MFLMPALQCFEKVSSVRTPLSERRGKIFGFRRIAAFVLQASAPPLLVFQTTFRCVQMLARFIKITTFALCCH
jgi:hypothetical protein